MEEMQSSHFNVGLLQKYATMESKDIIPTLRASRSFSPIRRAGFFDGLAANIDVFENRVQFALDGLMEWTEVCDEPKISLNLDKKWHVDTKKRAEQKTEDEKFVGVENKLMEAMYYTVYVVVLWRHKYGFCRYQSAIETFDSFKLRYSTDIMYVNQKQYDLVSMNHEEWLTFFQYRNIVILASSVSPKKASQKCIFMKIIGCLVEDKIHATGSKQSHAAARIAHIYDREGGTFNQRKSEQFNGASIKITRKRPKSEAGDASPNKALRVSGTTDHVAFDADHTEGFADILLSLSGGAPPAGAGPASGSSSSTAAAIPSSAISMSATIEAMTGDLTEADSAVATLLVPKIEPGAAAVSVRGAVELESDGEGAPRSRVASTSSDCSLPAVLPVALAMMEAGSGNSSQDYRESSVVSVQTVVAPQDKDEDQLQDEGSEIDFTTMPCAFSHCSASAGSCVVSPETPALLPVSPAPMVVSGPGTPTDGSSVSGVVVAADSESKCYFGSELVVGDSQQLLST